MKEAIKFFNQSSKRNAIIKTRLGGQLVNLCETRWVERHDAVILFYYSLPDIVDAFTEISEWKESESSKKAVLYISSITNTEFIISCVCLVDILKRTLPLSRLLQKPALDLNKASNAVKDTVQSLNERRNRCEMSFLEQFLEAKTTAEKLGVQLVLPRTTKRQCHRENYEANTVEDYFRVSMYIPLLDNVINDLQTRFSPDILMNFDLNLLLPEVILKSYTSDTGDESQRLMKVVRNFINILPVKNEIIIDGEVSIWKSKWVREKEEGGKIPVDVIDVLKSCDEDFYPSIRQLLQILITMPISVASAERSFSSLKLVKSWLRTRMVEERLNGLCLLFIHKDIKVDVDKVIERYAKGAKRRLQLDIIL